MGCCTRFHRTWWPGYTTEVIDPNKAFDFQRRLNLIKKAIIALCIIALVAASIYLVVRLTSGSSDPNCPQNSTEPVTASQAAAINNTSTPLLIQPEKQALNQAVPVPEPPHHGNESNPTKNATTPTEVPTTTPTTATPSPNTTTTASSKTTEPLPDNSTLSLIGVMHEVHADKSKNDSSIKLINSDEPRSWCSSKKNVVECVGLSKNFKTVKTFSGNSSKPKDNSTVEGFVMVKLEEDNIWHPYCYQDWSLQMAYKLCHGLGFADLIKLNIISLTELQQRVHQLGKDVSLQNLAVVQGKQNHSDAVNTHSSANLLNCDVGSVVCG